MVWQNPGDYLAVKVTRHTKSKKTFYNNIELFRLNEPGVPIEMLEIKDAIMALTWEPSGSRFAMIHAPNPQAAKVSVSFYDMMKKQETTTGGATSVVGMSNKKGGKKQNQQTTYTPELNKVITLEGKGCNCLFWSPAGSTMLMASLGDSASGTLEFYDVDTTSLTIKEHYRANQVLWDPAGRTVATCVSQPIDGGHFKFAMDNGYIIWSFQGKQLFQQSFETFYQLLWRPRESLLSKSQIEKVKKDLKKYEKQFEKVRNIQDWKSSQNVIYVCLCCCCCCCCCYYGGTVSQYRLLFGLITRLDLDSYTGRQGTRTCTVFGRDEGKARREEEDQRFANAIGRLASRATSTSCGIAGRVRQ
jgi:translation initiation factor 3 subunit B